MDKMIARFALAAILLSACLTMSADDLVRDGFSFASGQLRTALAAVDSAAASETGPRLIS